MRPKGKLFRIVCTSIFILWAFWFEAILMLIICVEVGIRPLTANFPVSMLLLLFCCKFAWWLWLIHEAYCIDYFSYVLSIMCTSFPCFNLSCLGALAILNLAPKWWTWCYCAAVAETVILLQLRITIASQLFIGIEWFQLHIVKHDV